MAGVSPPDASIVKNLRGVKPTKSARCRGHFIAYQAVAAGTVQDRVLNMSRLVPPITPRPALAGRGGWSSRLRTAWSVVACSGCLLFTAPGQTQTADPAIDAWTQQTADWIRQQVETGHHGSQGLRPEVEVGQLDSRLRLAPCQRVEPYLPTGTRLWGRTRIGLRCLEGPVAWNVFLPITVRAWGPAWTVRQPVAAGSVITEADLEQTEIDWAESVSPVLFQQSDWLGREAARHLVPGQVLRQGMVRAPQVFTAGTQVRVLIRGEGFSLSATGSALSHGHLGQTARIRMPNRKVLTGTVIDAETVEMSL